MREDIIDPKKNEWLDPAEDISDLLFAEGETVVPLGKQKQAVLYEYLGGGKPITQEQCELFLTLVSEGMAMTQAAPLAGTAIRTIVRLRKNNEVFAAALQEAMEIRDAALVEKSIEQATEGVRGANGSRVFPANPQLVMHVKAADPDRFRDRSEVIQRRGEDAKPIRQEGDREKLLALLKKYGTKPDAGDDVDDLL